MVKKIGLLLSLSFFLSIAYKQVEAVDYGFNQDYIYYITGDGSEGEFDFYYGTAKHRVQGEFSALVVMKYHETDTLYRTIIVDDGLNENTTFIGFFEDGSFGVVIERFQFDYTIMDYMFVSTDICKYDNYGNYTNRISYKEKFGGYNNHGNKIILSREGNNTSDIVLDINLNVVNLLDKYETKQPFLYQYQGLATINGENVEDICLDEVGHYEITISRNHYHYNFEVIVLPSIIGLDNNGEYLQSIMINSNGKLKLDGEIIEAMTSVTEVGHHTLTIEGEGGYLASYDFTIIPMISGVEDKGEYLNGVYIEFSDGQAYLNSVSYVNNTLIARPGTYKLEIIGVNDYRYSINFSILPSVMNLENQGKYETGFILNFIGEGKLNGNEVESGMVMEPGEHCFELWFEGSVYQQYSFTITETSSQTNHEQLKIPYLEIILGIISLVGGFLIFRKK